MNNVSIELIEVYHRQKYCIGILFKYDSQTIQKCRDAGAMWSRSHRCWLLENTVKNYYTLKSLLTGCGSLNESKLQAAHRDRMAGKILNRDFRLEVAGTPSDEAQKYLELFRQYLRTKAFTERTVDTYMGIIKAFLNYYRDRDPMQLDVRDYNAYCDQHVVKGGYSLSYHRQVSSALRKFYENFKTGKMEIEKIESPKNRFTLPTVLSRDEVTRLIQKSPNEKARMIVTLLYSTGLRVGELVELQWDQIQYDEGLIWVRRGKGKKDRQVPLSSKVAEQLNHYKKRFGQSTYVFEGQYGGPYTARSVNAYITAMAQAAQIKKKVSAHTLRHSFATHLLGGGTDLRYIQTLLGHSSSKTTEIYTHVSMRKLKELENPFDKLNL
ncbi:MAG TPA: hypothetical protein DIW47_14430 [Bacteroidetes bacterium]|nr:hypothetical protein [Bacteroidota bacterium]